jgi:sorbitol-specific phosphotransferase system component IIA
MANNAAQTAQQQAAAAQGASFKVGESYSIVDVVGEGAYGVVW